METIVKIGKVLLAVASVLVPMALLVAGFWLPVSLICKVILALGLVCVLDMALMYFETVNGKLENCKSFSDALCKQYFYSITVALVILIGMGGYIFYATGHMNFMLAEVAFALWLIPLIAAGLHSLFAENNLEAWMCFCGAIMFLGVEVFLCIHLFEVKVVDYTYIAQAFIKVGFAGCVVCGAVSILLWLKKKIALG